MNNRIRVRTSPILLVLPAFFTLILNLLLTLTATTAFGQGTAFTYQGRVTDNGTNFNGTGQFEFALVTSTNGQQATATAVMGGVSPNEFLSSCTVGIVGSGYSTAPNVHITGGGGTGATAKANLSGGTVISITVLTPGSGYSSTPTIIIDPPSTDYTTWWSNDGTSVNGSEPAAAVSVSVSQGLFMVVLGNTTLSNMTTIPGSIFNTETNLQLLIWFNDGASGFAMLAPPQSLTPTPYAIIAQGVNGTIPAVQLTSIGNTSGGIGNFFVGTSGNATTSGSDNTANGFDALFANTSGAYNEANGYEALTANTSGTANSANGYFAMVNNTSGSDNTADGVNALDSNTSGIGNTADGAAALYFTTSGSYNIGLGYLAGFNLSTGSNNIDIGNQGVYTDTNIIRIGSGQAQAFIAGVINGNGGGLINLNAAQLISVGNLTGVDNFFVGPSGNATTSGFNNTAEGWQALVANTSGNYNTAIGSTALQYNTSGSFNTADGLDALSANTNGSGNTATGAQALGANTSGTDNTANGYGALGANTSGFDNTANGTVALTANSSGSFNTADGFEASYGNQTGIANTADGYSALYANSSGSTNIAVGYAAGQNITGSFNIDIGNPGVAGEKGIIRIGIPGLHTATYLSGTVYANGVALTSDRNSKENFTAINARAVLDKVASLPITEWNYKSDKDAEHIGPMAQDFKAAFGLDGADDKHISVVDEGGVALAAVQGLNQKLEEQIKAGKQKDAEISNLKEQVNELEAEMKALAQH